MMRSVGEGHDGSFIKAMVNKSVFDSGYQLHRFPKLRVSESKRCSTTSANLKRKLSSSERFYVRFRSGASETNLRPPFTESGGEDAKVFKLQSRSFFALIAACRKEKDVAVKLARFLRDTDSLRSSELRSEVFYQLMQNLSSLPIRNTNDGGGEYTLVPHALFGSDHVVAVLGFLLSIFDVPTELGPYVVAFVVQNLGKEEVRGLLLCCTIPIDLYSSSRVFILSFVSMNFGVQFSPHYLPGCTYAPSKKIISFFVYNSSFSLLYSGRNTRV
jgi:hypothetical protein